MSPASISPVRFGDFELDLRTGELRRNGIDLKLQPQPAKVLALLVSRAGEVVTRDELAKHVWGPETFVAFDGGLNFAIRQIRAALHDDPDVPRFIETLAKRGYRFVATIQAETPGPALTPSPVPSTIAPKGVQQKVLLYGIALLAIAAVGGALLWWRLDSKSSAAGAAAITSVAVLPLHNLSTDREQAYFSDGMTDELITELARIRGLRVISHTSVERYRETKLLLPQIARELGADAVIEGTVMRSGDRVRITAQLIDARSDQHLWAKSYEGDLRDVMTLQGEVARQIATEVGIALTPGEQSRLAKPRPVDPVAYEAFLRGNFYWNKLNCDGFNKSLEYFQEAIAKDPNFAEAYNGAADSYFNIADWGCAPQEEIFPKCKAAALKAAELDPQLGDAHIVFGELAFYHDWDWAKAENEYKRAVEMEPNDSGAHASYAIYLVSMGRQEQGLAEMQKARELDPVSEITNVQGAYIFYLSRRYDDAIDQAKKTLDLYPSSGSAYYWLGQAYERKGMDDQAVGAYLKPDLPSGKSAAQEEALAVYRKSGLRGYWQYRFQERDKEVPTGSCWKMLLYAHIGDKEQTLKALNWGYEHHCDGLQFLKTEPVYDYLRDDPKFKDLIARLRL